MGRRPLIHAAASLIVIMSLFSSVYPQALDRTPPKMPDLKIGSTRGNDSGDSLDKLSAELRLLYEQYGASNGSAIQPDESGLRGFTSQQLSTIFAFNFDTSNSLVAVSLRCSSLGQIDSIKKAGVNVISQAGNVVYGVAPVSSLRTLAELRTVYSIEEFDSLRIPAPPPNDETPTFTIRERGGPVPVHAALANEFDKQKLTGKGVVIGVIDSGIDWHHEDFIRPDGTSRILAIWDLMDFSYQTSNGSIGSKPPVYLEKESKWLGTLYTNAQINAAIKGTGTVNSTDKFGHGTAVAGTAAGNGRATANGVPVGTYAGVAPDADLIIVKAMDCGFFSPVAELTSEWITEYAKALGRPVAINMSFGGQFSSHDGTTEGEQFIDTLTGPGKPGKIIAVAAGNDGRYSLHASSRFAPKRPGQADQFSSPIELSVKAPTQVSAVFNSTDAWGIVFRSNSPIFSGTDGKPVPFMVFRNNGILDHKSLGTLVDPAAVEQFFSRIKLFTAKAPEKTDTMLFQFPAGDYLFWGYGTTPNVTDGRFDLYSVESAYLNKAFFGMGTDKNGIVGSPGNAKNAITVGSFDFRNSWVNSSGETTTYNLSVGGPSNYTSAGFRRDGVIKPDISAPARYTISSLSAAAKPSMGGCPDSMATGEGTNFTLDGLHVAWDGTSAATPFTAGVIALMLQKNPGLDSEQVRQILKKTAKSGGAIGAVPNPLWGWGMINPSGAIAATPVRRK